MTDPYRGAALTRRLAKLEGLTRTLLHACAQAEGVLTEPGVMDVDQWKRWQRQTVAELRAAMAAAKEQL